MSYDNNYISNNNCLNILFKKNECSKTFSFLFNFQNNETSKQNDIDRLNDWCKKLDNFNQNILLNWFFFIARNFLNSDFINSLLIPFFLS